MASILLRPSTVRSALRAINQSKPLSTTFIRGKATVPDLPCMPSPPKTPCFPLTIQWLKSPLPRRLLRPRALDLRPNNGTPPLQAPHHLRQQLQQLLRASRCPFLLLSLRHRAANRSTTAPQLSRRRAHQPLPILGKSSAEKPGRG